MSLGQKRASFCHQSVRIVNHHSFSVPVFSSVLSLYLLIQPLSIFKFLVLAFLVMGRGWGGDEYNTDPSLSELTAG